MNNGFWEFYALEIDEEPTMKEKIDCINNILDETPYFLDDVYDKLKHLLTIYESNMYKLLNEEQELDFIRIGIDEKGGWHIPSIYF